MSEKLDIAISELENFVQSRIWKVLIQAMVDRTNEKIGETITLDPVEKPTQIARNQGFIEALSFIVDYPAILKEQVEFENREEKNDGKE